VDNSIRCRLGRSLANGRRHVRDGSSGASRRSAAFPDLANPISAFGGNLHGGTQGKPNVAHRHSCRDGALRREITQLTQHQVPHQGATVDLTELVGDRAPELTQPHCLTRTASLAFLSPPEAPRTNAPHPARADQSASVVESSARRGEWMSLTDDHSRIEVRNEVVGNRIGNHIDPLDNCQTIPHFTHDDGNRRL
jgi:hypothetical protein